MNNKNIENKIIIDKDKFRAIIKLSGKKFKQKEAKGMTKAQTITEIVEGIEKVLKDGN